MPTNLPPDYYKIEEEFRAAKETEQKIALLQEMISVVPKHKGTDHLRADLRRKLSKLKESATSRKKVSRFTSVYNIDKEGAGQVVLIGPANTGKSSLVAALTNAAPEVEDYPFSTWGPTPGMMPIEDIQVQLIDTPPLDRDFIEPEFLDLIRRSDLVLLVIDLQDYPIEQLERTYEFLLNHRILLEGGSYEPEGRGWTRKPTLLLANKCDDASYLDDYRVFLEMIDPHWKALPISAQKGFGVEEFKSEVFKTLEVMRIYSKSPGQEADLKVPYVVPQGTTVEEFAAKVHQDFAKNLKATRVWGSSDFDGQMVSRDYVLRDGDIVELKI